ncbi:TetR/AcrR family transcriptional regulator [Bradyrhizobium sp. LM2.9]
MKERILETADKLFYLQGIRAIGVDTIAAEIGISKRTLYNHFPSKDALIAAYLERRFVQPPAPPTRPRPSRSSPPSIRWSGVLRPRIFAAARS